MWRRGLFSVLNKATFYMADDIKHSSSISLCHLKLTHNKPIMWRERSWGELCIILQDEQGVLAGGVLEMQFKMSELSGKEERCWEEWNLGDTQTRGCQAADHCSRGRFNKAIRCYSTRRQDILQSGYWQQKLDILNLMSGQFAACVCGDRNR